MRLLAPCPTPISSFLVFLKLTWWSQCKYEVSLFWTGDHNYLFQEITCYRATPQAHVAQVNGCITMRCNWLRGDHPADGDDEKIPLGVKVDIRRNAPRSVARGASRSGDRAAKGMPRPHQCTAGRSHPALRSHLPAEDTAPPFRGRASLIDALRLMR
jgi:hypothetical protein